MMNKFTWLVAFSTVVTLASAVQAQGSNGLVSVLGKAKTVALNGKASISEQKPEGGKGFGGAVMMFGGVGGGNNAPVPFTGEVEVFVKAGTLAAVSGGKLPRVRVYRNGKKQLFSQMHSGAPVDTQGLGVFLSRILDLDSLIAEVKRAKRVRSKSVDGGKNYRLTIGGDYFDKKAEDVGDDPAAQMAMAMGSVGESVIEAVLSVDVNTKGDLRAMKLEVQYNDPLGDMIAQAMKGGGGAIQIQAGDGKKSTKPGKKVTLDFTVSDKESKVAKAFADEAAKMLK